MEALQVDHVGRGCERRRLVFRRDIQTSPSCFMRCGVWVSGKAKMISTKLCKEYLLMSLHPRSGVGSVVLQRLLIVFGTKKHQTPSQHLKCAYGSTSRDVFRASWRRKISQAPEIFCIYVIKGPNLKKKKRKENLNSLLFFLKTGAFWSFSSHGGSGDAFALSHPCSCALGITPHPPKMWLSLREWRVVVEQWKLSGLFEAETQKLGLDSPGF